ncbi:hypothetical protein HanXRQr2_Chr00c161g0834131 [Helianthus annuus]|uniref:Uncharacterized protein n=1 Tax=Helianthus annuus TaxID=4232 RepID=A0A9K3P5E9_HELAN|nr:hypothetical protein HanXRQr2_Chr00c161g0834131 [Helianthus annuus]KAJ0943323.1 hypothetical protein HanPSC8_Chr03g0102881 [Helianthus annuus]
MKMELLVLSSLEWKMNHVTRLLPAVGSIGPQSFGTNYSITASFVVIM